LPVTDFTWPIGVHEPLVCRIAWYRPPVFVLTSGRTFSAGEEFTYTWEATPDSVGVWPYHDHGPNHTLNTFRGLFGAKQLKAMKRPASLVSTARGGIIDEKALHDALSRDQIAGAALDVFDQEPTPADNPLLTLKNFIAAPHVAGVTREAVNKQLREWKKDGLVDMQDGQMLILDPKGLSAIVGR